MGESAHSVNDVSTGRPGAGIVGDTTGHRRATIHGWDVGCGEDPVLINIVCVHGRLSKITIATSIVELSRVSTPV